MLFEDIYSSAGLSATQLQPIVKHCSQFLEEAGNFPLLKNLSDGYPDVHRVKVRQMKPQEIISDSYNRAFGEDFRNLRERAVFASPNYSAAQIGQEPYYIFPVNGYKYLYSKEVLNSSVAYQKVINLLMEDADDSAQAIDTFSSLLKFTYCSSNLSEGMSVGAEIILYHIPHFYAVKASSVKGYDRLIHAINREI